MGRRRVLGRAGRAAACLVAGLGLLAFGPLAAAQTDPPAADEPAADDPAVDDPAVDDPAVVDVVEIEGVLDSVVLDDVRETIAAADAGGSELVAIRVDSQSGLNVTADELIATVTESSVPVLVYVGPAGARAAGAAAVLAQAAHILAMAPVTQMGHVQPVDVGHPHREETADLAARLRELARLRGRDPGAAEAALTENRVFVVQAEGSTEDEVPNDAILPGGPVSTLSPREAVEEGVVDLVEPTFGATLAALGGYEVALPDADGAVTERTLAIDEGSASVRVHTLCLLRRVLHTVADPTLAYLLVVAGAIAILFEIFQPGFGVAGIAGLGLAALGAYGLNVLPVNWFAFALLLVGMVLLAVDLALAGLGALTLAGTAAFGTGSYFLFGGQQDLRVSLWVLVVVTLFVVAFFVLVMTTVLRAQGNQAITGAEGLIGKTGVVRSMLNPEGHVFLNGALWRARAPEAAGKVRTGALVRVLALNDALTLEVEVVEQDAPVR